MGLGSYGGGVSVARFFLDQGSRVIITDLAVKEQLKESIGLLEPFKAAIFVLGEHRKKDFLESDLILKNPAVSWKSPYLTLAKTAGVPIETDLSLFCLWNKRPLLAITGSKGKSSTVSALTQIHKFQDPGAEMAGNITKPIFDYIEKESSSLLVLELSSWQLGDLKIASSSSHFHPKIAAMTQLLPDHLDTYNSFEAYIEDKKELFRHQKKQDFFVFNAQDPHQKFFLDEITSSKIAFFPQILEPFEVEQKINKDSVFRGIQHYAFFNQNTLVLVKKSAKNEEKQAKSVEIFEHKKNFFNLSLSTYFEKENFFLPISTKKNLGLAVFLSFLSGQNKQSILRSLNTYRPLIARTQWIASFNKTRFFNNTMATIPEAVLETVCDFQGLNEKLFLILGGSDKSLDFSVFSSLKDQVDNLFLLEGTATDAMIKVFIQYSIPFFGPFSSFDTLIPHIFQKILLNTPTNVVLAPGCASFGLFKNAFDRGKIFSSSLQKHLKTLTEF